MKGWKTWLAVAGWVALGVASIASGDTDGGMQRIVEGLTLLGIGHKIEKVFGK